MPFTRDGSLGYATATIAVSGLSDAVALSDTRAVAFQFPSYIDGTALTFQGSADGVTYDNIYTRAGIELSYTVAALRYVVADPADFAGCAFIKLRMGTAASPTAQTGPHFVKVVAQAL